MNIRRSAAKGTEWLFYDKGQRPGPGGDRPDQRANQRDDDDATPAAPRVRPTRRNERSAGAHPGMEDRRVAVSKGVTVAARGSRAGGGPGPRDNYQDGTAGGFGSTARALPGPRPQRPPLRTARAATTRPRRGCPPTDRSRGNYQPRSRRLPEPRTVVDSRPGPAGNYQGPPAETARLAASGPSRPRPDSSSRAPLRRLRPRLLRPPGLRCDIEAVDSARRPRGDQELLDGATGHRSLASEMAVAEVVEPSPEVIDASKLPSR